MVEPITCFSATTFMCTNVNTECVSQEDVLQWVVKEKEELTLATRTSSGGYRLISVCVHISYDTYRYERHSRRAMVRAKS